MEPEIPWLPLAQRVTNTARIIVIALVIGCVFFLAIAVVASQDRPRQFGPPTV